MKPQGSVQGQISFKLQTYLDLRTSCTTGFWRSFLLIFYGFKVQKSLYKTLLRIGQYRIGIVRFNSLRITLRWLQWVLRSAGGVVFPTYRSATRLREWGWLLHKTYWGFAGITPDSSVMLDERLAKGFVLDKWIYRIILSNRVARDCSIRGNMLNVFENFAALRLRHCGESSVTQQYKKVKNIY